MMSPDLEKAKAVLHECAVHARRIASARTRCAAHFPLSGESYRHLTDDDIAHIDQLIYRYTKLQDALGAKLFPFIVAHLREDTASLTVLDRLTQLERSQVIADAQRWQELREVRNQLAHDYEDDASEAVGYLNDLYAASAELLSYHERAARFAQERILSAG